MSVKRPTKDSKKIKVQKRKMIIKRAIGDEWKKFAFFDEKIIKFGLS